MTDRKPTVVVLCGALMIIMSMGIRQTYGLFLQPISQDLVMGREVFSFAMALLSLISGLPLFGMIADRYGPRLVVQGGAILYATGFLLLSRITNPIGLYLTLGLTLGLALSSVSYVVVLGAVAQAVSPKRRSFAFGIITASGSFGMFALVPSVQWLISAVGWQTTFRILAAFLFAVVFLAFGFPRHDRVRSAQSKEDGHETLSLTQILLKVRAHSGFWLLTSGFFVCGFHVTFIGTHLPAFLADNGISKMVGASTLSLVGLFNIFGSSFFGFLGDRIRKKYLLSFTYFSRACIISLFLLFPLSNISALLFGGFFGFLWLATVPLTSGTVAQIFGSRYLSTLYGIVFFSHQLGSFMGVWLGGRVYDTTGSYSIVWIMAIVLGVMSGIVHLPIKDKPIDLRSFD